MGKNATAPARPRIEDCLTEVADILVLSRRSLRQLGKRLRQPPGHAGSLAASRAELEPLLRQEAIAWRPRTQTGWVVAIAAPAPAEAQRLGPELAYERELRLAFHGAVHAAFEQLALDPVAVRQRVRRLGRAEFEEIRHLLERDERLYRPSDDREVYIEFAANYLELRLFAPELLPAAFPGLTHLERIHEIVAADIDVPRLSAACGVSERPLWEPDSIPPSVARATGDSLLGVPAHGKLGLVARLRQSWLLGAARRARYAERYARSAVLAARVLGSADPELRSQAKSTFDSAIDQLSAGLALLTSETDAAPLAWSDSLRLLALRAGRRFGYRSLSETKLLEVLERAARIQRWPLHVVRPVLFKRGLGQRVLVLQARALKAVQVAQLLAQAAERGDTLRLPAEYASVVLPVLRSACELSRDQARATLSRRLSGVLERAGLCARSGLEQLARWRLVEELVDRILLRGFISLPQLRDAVSRNDLKLRDVELFGSSGRDPLLAADVLLARSLVGVYRRGDVYLRALQKASSLSFGTSVGRAVFLYAVMPFAGAFVLLEGAQHLVNPALHWADLPQLPAPDPISIAVTTIALLGLIHSCALRTLSRQLLEFVGILLASLLFRIPRALFTQPVVQRWLSRPVTRRLLRHVVIPALLAVGVYAAMPLGVEDLVLRSLAAAVSFAAMSWLMGSRLGFWLEGFVTDRLAPTWKVLGQRWLPELLTVVGRTFAALVEGMERIIASVDELLRSQRRPRGLRLVVLTAMTIAWGTIAYVVRLYVTLLVEPELNPLKHFPVVTVAHKVMLPFLPTLLEWVDGPFAILGPFVGGALAGLTVFLLPSVFGFLVWELKENFRLYAATRPLHIQPARFGPAGETLRELLVVGLHSGTLPKHYERLRRAAQRSDERRQRARAQHKRPPPFAHDPELQRFRQKIHAARLAVTRFVERELLPTISEHPAWTHAELSVDRVELSSNRVRVQMTCPSLSYEPSELCFEQLGGHIVASCPRAGFIRTLSESEATLFCNALGVFYHRAGVDLVREQLSAVLPGSDYEIGEGLVAVYDGGRLSMTYATDIKWPRQLKPRLHDRHTTLAAPQIHARQMLFGHQPITWKAWQNSWTAVPTEHLERLVGGPSLLPER